MQVEALREENQPFIVRVRNATTPNPEVILLPEIQTLGAVIQADEVYHNGAVVKENIDVETGVAKVVHQRGPWHSYFTQVFLADGVGYDEPIEVEVQELSMEQSDLYKNPDAYRRQA